MREHNVILAYAWDRHFSYGWPSGVAMACDVIKCGPIAMVSLKIFGKQLQSSHGMANVFFLI